MNNSQANICESAVANEDALEMGRYRLRSLSQLAIVFAGVGGQGIIHLSKEVISGLGSRFNRILSTQHRGLAKARGSVAVHMRAGKSVRTAEIFSGRVDLLIAMELHEAIRHLHLLDKNSVCLFADIAIGSSPKLPANRLHLLQQIEGALPTLHAISLGVPLHNEMNTRSNYSERHGALALLGVLSRLLSLPKLPPEKTFCPGFDSFAWGQKWNP